MHTNLCISVKGSYLSCVRNGEFHFIIMILTLVLLECVKDKFYIHRLLIDTKKPEAVDNSTLENAMSEHCVGLDDLNEYYDNHTAIMWACIRGHTEAIKYFIGKKVDLKKKSRNGETLLMLVMANWNEALNNTKILLGEKDSSVDINDEDNDGWTVVMKGAKDDVWSLIIKELIEHKADINHMKKDKTTAIFFACKNGNEETVYYLLCKRNEHDGKRWVRHLDVETASESSAREECMKNEIELPVEEEDSEVCTNYL